MATIGLIPHTGREAAVTLAASTAAWLVAGGHRAPVFSGQGAEGSEPSDPLRHVASELDLAVTLGGDGTMLRAVDLVAPFGVPVLGVNVGHLGFLTEIGPAQLLPALEQFLAGEFHTEDRMTLAVEVRYRSDDRPPRRRTALNDAVLQRSSSGHTVRLAVSLSGSPFLTYAADSMIVATPTGSTAYNLSARGPIASPRTRVIVMTPVAAHMLFDRSLVLAEDEDISFEVIGDLPAELVVDGHSLGCLAAGDLVHCRVGEHNARFVEFASRDFHHVIKQKFGLADR